MLTFMLTLTFAGNEIYIIQFAVQFSWYPDVLLFAVGFSLTNFMIQNCTIFIKYDCNLTMFFLLMLTFA